MVWHSTQRAFSSMVMIKSKAQLNVHTVPVLQQRNQSWLHPGDLVIHAEHSYTYCLHTIERFNKRGTGGSFSGRCDDLDPKSLIIVIAEFIAKPRHNTNWWNGRGVRWVLATLNNRVYWITRDAIRKDA